MQGFASRADVEDVEGFLAREVTALAAEGVDLAGCAGRVLAEDVRSRVDVPGFDRSAMDGYAVRGEDTFGASDYDPVRLALRGESMPGRPFAGAIGPGEAVRIMTGAPLPAGADAVVMAEAAAEQGDAVDVREAVPPRKHVGARGEDLRRGDVVLRRGRRLRPQDVGLLASIGEPRVVVRPPAAGGIRHHGRRAPAGRLGSRRLPHRRQQQRDAARAGRAGRG